MSARLASRIAVLALALALAGCVPAPGPAFLRAAAAGDRAHSAGRLGEAAAAYEEASRVATRPRDRDEALFRAAELRRANGEPAVASAHLRALIAASPRSDRAPRAAYELAEIAVAGGDEASGFAAYDRALVDYPEAGSARRAFAVRVEHLRARGGEHAVLDWLAAMAPKLAASDLDENVRRERAASQRALGDLAAARDELVACARAHPYPAGSLFDDVLWEASEIDEALGDAPRAIADLREMLRVREPSAMNGSYERPRFGPAQMRIATLLRDRVGDRAAARRELHALYRDFPTSLLRDDALWEEAKLAKADGDGAAACAALGDLVRDLPTSRYAACVAALCPSLTPPREAGACHAYVVPADDAR